MPAVLQRMMRHKSILTTMQRFATGDAHALVRSIREFARSAGKQVRRERNAVTAVTTV